MQWREKSQLTPQKSQLKWKIDCRGPRNIQFHVIFKGPLSGAFWLPLHCYPGWHCPLSYGASSSGKNHPRKKWGQTRKYDSIVTCCLAWSAIQISWFLNHFLALFFCFLYDKATIANKLQFKGNEISRDLTAKIVIYFSCIENFFVWRFYQLQKVSSISHLLQLGLTIFLSLTAVAVILSSNCQERGDRKCWIDNWKLLKTFKVRLSK